MPEKPKLRPQKKASDSSSQPIAAAKTSQPSLLNISSDADRIPLMFQAQIQERGNIQYVGDRENSDRPKYEQWVEEWLEGCPPQPERVDESIPIWKRKPIQAVVKLPQFGNQVAPWIYTIRWRMVTNGGQDEDLIRPVIGSKGVPFFPGSSMKGAFRNACPAEKRQRYCGGEVVDASGNKRMEPGILRFHGGYPIDMSWAQINRLVDIAHAQQPYQVMRSTKPKGENANVQISLYQPRFRFGISCPEIPRDSAEWVEIKEIWEKALGYGIGSRTSAGYGYVEEVQSIRDRVLMSVHLNGQGISSQLLLKASSEDRHKTPEFRPNMFKAALRGHTLRILGGLVDEGTAKLLTQKIWGGIPEKGERGKAVVGCVGIDFRIEGEIGSGHHVYRQINKSGKQVSVKMPVYKLSNGRLDLIRIGKVKPELEAFLVSLIKFSVLFGGFGKSWRRVDHRQFYSKYFSNNDKPMIGCHWELTAASQNFLVYPNSDLSGITRFIEDIREQAIAWIQSEMGQYQVGYAQGWREAWHPNNVQVWGRIAQDGQSEAVEWFHNRQLKGSELAGKMGKIGRTWHRMYPVEGEFVELLTIFPDQSKPTEDFLNSLKRHSSGFRSVWRGKKE